jgi:large subunit ribosomal protein L21
MYAVIKTGGKQYRVAEGQHIRVEKIQALEGASVDLKEVLMIADGDQVTVGTPFVDGGHVTAVVKTHGRAPKVEIIKFRRRKHYRKQMGHRQSYTELEVTRIAGPGMDRSAAGEAGTVAVDADATDTAGVMLDKGDD